MIDALFRTSLRVAYRLLRIWWLVRRPEVHGAYVAVWHAGRLLLVRNSYRRGETVPCGGIGRRESARDAAVRELGEEVGLRVAAEDVVPWGEIAVNFEHKTDHAHFFELRLGDEPELTVDNREVVWAGFVPAGELSGRPLVPHLRRYLDDAPPRDDQ